MPRGEQGGAGEGAPELPDDGTRLRQDQAEGHRHHVLAVLHHRRHRHGHGQERELGGRADVRQGAEAILQEVAEDVAAGHSLANSFESKGGAKLPVLFYETIRAGEQAGTLDRSFDTLHKYYDKAYKTTEKIKSVLTYPYLSLRSR